MSQINEDQEFAVRRRVLRANNLAVSVGTGANTTLLELFVSGVEKISVQFDVTVANLDAFQIQSRVSPDASYITVASTAAQYTAPSGRILSASGDLTTVAAAASGSFDMDVSGLEAVKISASATGSAATVSIYANGTAGGQGNTNVALTAGDIEIGAVEIKDGTTDTRAVVGANGVIVGGSGTALTPSTAALTAQRPAVTQVVSTALEASHVLKASAGQLVQLSVFNSKASAQYILVMNSATLPGDGAVTLLYPPIPIGAASLLVLDLPAPLVASTGITVCNSSTGSFTKTIGSADCAFYAQVN